MMENDIKLYKTKIDKLHLRSKKVKQLLLSKKKLAKDLKTREKELFRLNKEFTGLKEESK